jgi:DNA-binding MarR family transcriptional regulator
MSGSALDRRRRALVELQSLLVRCTIELTRITNAELGRGTGGNRAVQVLLAVHDEPGVSPSHLADHLGVARSAIARAVRDLEHQEVVSRTADRRDRRVMRLHLTDLGRRRIESFERAVAERFRADAAAVTAALDRVQGPPAVAPAASTPLAAVRALADAGAAYVDDVEVAMTSYGATHPSERFAVALLLDTSGLRPVALATALHLTTGGISQLLDRLEARQLVDRSPRLDADRRAVVVRLTEHGEAAAITALDIMAAHRVPLCAALRQTTILDESSGAA